MTKLLYVGRWSKYSLLRTLGFVLRTQRNNIKYFKNQNGLTYLSSLITLLSLIVLFVDEQILFLFLAQGYHEKIKLFVS